jgi:prephenate dehydrogenase
MIIDTSKKFLIVGLGLMGGSYAMGLKRFGFRVSAITKDQNSVDYALKNKLIDKGSTSTDKELISEADIIIFALYPHDFMNWIKDNQQYIKKNALLTDVTGVKGCIVYKIQEILRDDLEFIAAHPMAGREVSGVENATDSIFIGANYIVTPTEKNSVTAIETCMQLGKILGFKRVSCLSPEEHDDVIGFVSQLTHCIAVSLMTCNDDIDIEKFTGDSFRDLTRIAKINEVMWSELFLANKPALLKQMNEFDAQFQKLRSALENDNVEKMKEIMRKSTARRKEFDKE